MAEVTDQPGSTLTPDTVVPERLGRLVCAAHLDEMNIAAQVGRDGRCPGRGEPSPFGALLHVRSSS